MHYFVNKIQSEPIEIYIDIVFWSLLYVTSTSLEHPSLPYISVYTPADIQLAVVLLFSFGFVHQYCLVLASFSQSVQPLHLLLPTAKHFSINGLPVRCYRDFSITLTQT